jgi:hypothetical protein
MQTLTVAGRFCGPPTSANGGYFAGVVATLAGSTLTVRLLKPPPLDTPLTVVELDQGMREIKGGEELIATARPASLELALEPPPLYVEAVEASRRCSGFAAHPFPTCFVCGPQRPRGDGLRIFAGPLPGREVVAAPWVPDSSLGGSDGKVRPEFMSAALDCPGYFAVSADGRAMVLAEITVHVDRLVRVDEPCMVIGWGTGRDGRKHMAGTAVFDARGGLCAAARALWIEPRPSEV